VGQYGARLAACAHGADIAVDIVGPLQDLRCKALEGMKLCASSRYGGGVAAKL